MAAVGVSIGRSSIFTNMRDVRDPQLKPDVRRVVQVLYVFSERESQQRTGDAMTQADAVLVLCRGELVERTEAKVARCRFI